MFSLIVLPLLIGLALFLFGMKLMELALHQWAGPYLKSLLERFTRTPWRGMLTGTGLTAILQSSSAITVITIGLVNAGIVTFPQTLGIILGTNIGTCITTELIGLPINHLGLPLLLSAAAAWFISLGISPLLHKKVPVHWIYAFRCIFLSATGFACVLIGMEVMQTIVPAMHSRGLFVWFLERSQRSLLWGVLAGACLTAVIQSSTAAIAITMGLASVQAISVDLGIAIIIGANIGTCTTAFIASIGGSKYGQYVAWFHTFLNIGGSILFFPLIPVLHEVSSWLATKPAGQLAHAQTLYNIASSLIALPFCYLRFFKATRK